MKLLLTTAASAMLAWGVAGSVPVVPHTDAAALEHFTRAVAAYMSLHERVEQTVPPLVVTGDAAELVRAADAMADAMRAARADARVGDLFTPDVASVFRRLLADAIQARGGAADLLARIARENAEDESAIGLAPVVNEPLGCGLASTPPFVFEVLPPLPSELQYRFVGRDLVLWDLHTELVVDVLVEALPTT